MIVIELKEKKLQLSHLDSQIKQLKEDNLGLFQIVNIYHENLSQLEKDLKILYPNMYSTKITNLSESNFINEILTLKKIPVISNKATIVDYVKRDIENCKKIVEYFYSIVEKEKKFNENFLNNFLKEKNENLILKKLKDDNEKNEISANSLKNEFLILKNKEKELKRTVNLKVAENLQNEKEKKILNENIEKLNEIIKKNLKEIEELKENVVFLEQENELLKKQKLEEINNIEKNGKQMENEEPIEPMGEELVKLRELVKNLQIEIEELKIVCQTRSKTIAERDDEIVTLKKKIMDEQRQTVTEEMIRASPLFESQEKMLSEFKIKDNEMVSEIKNRDMEILQLRSQLSVVNLGLENQAEKQVNELMEKIKKKDEIINILETSTEELKFQLSCANYQEKVAIQLKQANGKLESKNKRILKLTEDLKLYSENKDSLIQKLHFSQKNYKILKKDYDESRKNIVLLEKIRDEKIEKNVDVLLKENNDLKKQIEKNEAMLKNLGNDKGIKKINLLQEEINFEREVTEQYEKELQELQLHCEKLTQFKDKLQSQHREYEHSKSSFILSNVKDNKKMMIFSKEIDALKQQVSDLKEVISLSKKQNKTVTDLVKLKNDMIKKSKEQIEIEQRSVLKYEKEISKFNIKLKEAENMKQKAIMELNNQIEYSKKSIEKSADTEKKAKHYEEECEKLSKRIERLENSDANSEMLQRIDYWRNMAICSICKTNVKSMLILKCAHSFCQKCLNKSIKGRNRKCPSCGEQFEFVFLVN